MVILGALILFICALVFLWCGFQIRYRDRFELIDRFDSCRLKDPLAWARHCGLLQMLLGAGLLLTALSSLIWPTQSWQWGLAFIVAAMSAWGPLVTSLRVFEKD